MPLGIASFIFIALRFHINWLIVEETGITIKSCFGTIKSNEWNSIKNIFIYNFEETEKMKSGRFGIGGLIINVPQKNTTKMDICR